MSRLHEALALYVLFGMLMVAISLAAMGDEAAADFEKGLNKSGVALGWIAVLSALLLWLAAWPALIVAFYWKKSRNAKS